MSGLSANFAGTPASMAAGLPGELIFGMPGAAGGYYSISVTQANDTTIYLTFTPSQQIMPQIPPATITLPCGKDGYSPVRGTDFWTEEDKAEIQSYVEAAILGGAW